MSDPGVVRGSLIAFAFEGSNARRIVGTRNSSVTRTERVERPVQSVVALRWVGLRVQPAGQIGDHDLVGKAQRQRAQHLSVGLDPVVVEHRRQIADRRQRRLRWDHPDHPAGAGPQDLRRQQFVAVEEMLTKAASVGVSTPSAGFHIRSSMSRNVTIATTASGRNVSTWPTNPLRIPSQISR